MDRKFRFYLCSSGGTVEGTNSSDVAKRAAEEDDDVIAVIDTENNLDLLASDTVEIAQQTSYPE